MLQVIEEIKDEFIGTVDDAGTQTDIIAEIGRTTGKLYGLRICPNELYPNRKLRIIRFNDIDKLKNLIGGTKNNPLGGERFEIVLDDEESKEITLTNKRLEEGLF